MFNRKTANIALILIFSMSFTFLPDDAHAFVDCCPTDCSSYYYQNLKQPLSTGSCAMNCCSSLGKSSCKFEGCLDLDLPEAMISTAGMRDHTFPKIQFFSKDVAADYLPYVGIEQRRFSSSKEVSTPIYLKTLSLLC
jgi:hypothetical protein